MPNLPDDVTDKMVSEAGEATPATDAEVVIFIMQSVPKATEVNIIDHDGNDVCVSLWLERGDVER